MKHRNGRRLTREEKGLLKQQGFDHKYFLRLSKDAESYTFLEITSGKTLLVRR